MLSAYVLWKTAPNIHTISAQNNGQNHSRLSVHSLLLQEKTRQYLSLGSSHRAEQRPTFDKIVSREAVIIWCKNCIFNRHFASSL